MARLTDKVAVVTGAAHGIGAAIAERFAEEGAVLVLLDMDAQGLQRTADTISKHKVSTLTLTVDVTEEQPVEDAFAQIVAAHGRIDILVNDVGGSRNMKLWEMTADAWDFTIKLNLRSAFLCTRAALRTMMPQRPGTIICMSSGSREGTPWTALSSGGAAYSAAKAGIHGFIRDASMELAEYGIRVNAVAPGPIETDRTRATFDMLRQTSEYSPHILVPMRRLGQPREIADAALYLASDESSYVTGTTLAVAGGR